jgi:hypothetical protein
MIPPISPTHATASPLSILPSSCDLPSCSCACACAFPSLPLDCICRDSACVGSMLVGEGKLIRDSRLVGGQLVIRRVWKASGTGGQGLAIKAGSGLRRQGKSGVVLSRQVPLRCVLGCAVKAVKVGTIKAESDSVHGRQSYQGSSWFWFIGTLQVSQI